MTRLLLFAFLICSGCQQEWSFAVFGDADLGKLGQPRQALFPALVVAVNESGAELALFTGDLVHGRTLYRAETSGQYDLAQGILKRLAMPLLIVPGNHDWDGADGSVHYERAFGRVPWELTHRGWTFIGLSTEEAGSRGIITGEQEQWLRERLARAAGKGRTVVIMHRPVWPTPNIQQRYHSLAQPDLHRLFAKMGVVAVFSGHEHHFHREERDGVLYVITGGAGADLLADGYFHFVLASVIRSRLTVEVRPFQPNGDA